MDKEAQFYREANEVLDYLKEEHNTERTAVKSGVICELFCIHKERIRSLVNHLRCEGYPVCSSVNGYWYSEAPADIEKTLSHLEGRVSGMNRAISGLRESMNKKKMSKRAGRDGFQCIRLVS